MWWASKVSWHAATGSQAHQSIRPPAAACQMEGRCEQELVSSHSLIPIQLKGRVAYIRPTFHYCSVSEALQSLGGLDAASIVHES
jgi:hypothetical protein